ncbi:MAG: hypothetical protein MZV64_16140 [Ignavibacteriales bacterium]|nr:hypothetical protein [Ignavibacteriales bacterium]
MLDQMGIINEDSFLQYYKSFSKWEQRKSIIRIYPKYLSRKNGREIFGHKKIFSNDNEKAEEKDSKNIRTLHAHASNEDHFTSGIYQTAPYQNFIQHCLNITITTSLLMMKNNILIGFVVAGNKTNHAIEHIYQELIIMYYFLLALLKHPQFLF